jgi:hypothetical protein
MRSGGRGRDGEAVFRVTKMGEYKWAATNVGVVSTHVDAAMASAAFPWKVTRV